MHDEDLKFINHRELAELRKTQYEKQGCTCAVTGLPYSLEDCVFDHRHKRRDEPLGGPDKLGLLRGVIGNKINVFEGKLYRMFKRYGLVDEIPLPDLLRSLANYIENPPIKEKIVHPDERPKRKRLSIPDYKLVCKYWYAMYPRRQKFPDYPKDNIMSPRWIDMIEEAKEMRALDPKGLTEDQRANVRKAMNLMKDMDIKK